MKVKEQIQFLKGEYWYCGIVNDGYQFPLSKEDTYFIDLTKNDTYNQINPLFVSSKGRYVWLGKEASIRFDKGVITFEAEEYTFDDSAQTLKEACRKAREKFFSPNGKFPIEEIFTKPQLNTWIGLQGKQTQLRVLEYAKSYLECGYPPGVIYIDDGWQKDFGDWDFNNEKFPDPLEMVQQLHAMGFKVAIWMVPYVSKGLPVVRDLMEHSGLLKDASGRYIDAVWFDGVSYVLDFKCEYARNWLRSELYNLIEKYGIDGIKLDCGDAQFLDCAYPEANEQNELWASFSDGLKEDLFVELRSCYKNAGKQYIQRLADKACIWGVDYIEEKQFEGGYYKYGLSTVVPNMLTLGLVGYAYGCPDMVGGGLLGDFMKPDFCLQSEYLIRFCQCSTFFPTIQFSYPYWTHEDARVRNAMKSCIAAREKLLPYIWELAKKAAVDGEPIARYLEYEFPNEGYEKECNQYLIGDRYLIAPIMQKGQAKQTIRFPKNTLWKSLFKEEMHYEGEITFETDLTTLLYFERIK